MSFISDVPAVFNNTTKISNIIGDTTMNGNLVINQQLSANKINVDASLVIQNIDVHQKIIDTSNALSVIDSSLQSINTQFLQKQDVITDQTNLNVGRLTVNNSIISKEIKQIGGDIFTPTGMTMNRFGTSLSMNSSGDIIAVGAPYEKGENNENYAGSASVFKYENGSWNTLGQLIRGAGGGDRLGAGTACSLNSDGTILAVGSWFHDQSRGHTRVYEYNGTSWVQLGSDIDGINTGDNNGWSISINDSGYIIAIGSCSSDYHTGHTQVYEYDGTSWIQKGQLNLTANMFMVVAVFLYL